MEKDPEKAKKNLEKRLEKVTLRAEQLSKFIFDNDILDIIGRAYRYWEEINSDWVPWRNDPFMSWALRIPACI